MLFFDIMDLGYRKVNVFYLGCFMLSCYSDGPLVLDQCDLSERDFMAIHFRCWIAISASLVEKRWAK